MKNINYISGLIIIIVAGFFYSLTFNFPKMQGQMIGADFMPRVYSTLLIILGSILLIQGYLAKPKNKKEENTFKYAIGTMVFVLFYVILIPIIGFYISTVLLVFLLLLYSKVRNIVILVLIPLGTSLFIFIVFQQFLNVSIPLGSLFS